MGFEYFVCFYFACNLRVNLVPRLFLWGRKDPGRSWSRATQILGGKLKKHLGRGGRVCIIGFEIFIEIWKMNHVMLLSQQFSLINVKEWLYLM